MGVDAEVWERRWSNWKSTLRVCHRQVCRALSADADDTDGECGLAIVATATMLEAYVNMFAMSEVPDSDRERYMNLDPPDRVRLLPTYARGQSKKTEYTKQPAHADVDRIFEFRNKFAHGKLEEWLPADAPPSEVARLWNAALEALLALEVLGAFRIPVSRWDDYHAELKEFEVTIVRNR